MRILFVLEHHFERTPDGRVWTQAAYASRFWERFLTVFEEVRVVARVKETATQLAGKVRADGANISFAGIPDYTGPLQYLLQSREIQRKVRAAFRKGDAVILRVPSAIGTALLPALQAERYPYGLQVVGDPNQVFARGVVNHPLRIFWQQWFTHQLAQQCAHAAAAAYVTKTYLQERYPCPGYVSSFSDVELGADAFVQVPRPPRRMPGPLRIITVGTLAQLYKGPDILIQAASLCCAQGVDAELVILGEGKYLAMLQALAQERGLQGRVHFLGQLTAGAPVREQLDRADLFVLPSLTEGLPRALLEAMARALPCIGSTVGGIPELLEAEDLVPPGDAGALARKLGEILTDAPRMARMSERNLLRAREFRQDKLEAKQYAFYSYVQERTEQWLGEHP